MPRSACDIYLNYNEKRATFVTRYRLLRCCDRSEVVHVANTKLTGVVAKDTQDVVGHVELGVDIALVGHVSTINAERPSLIGRTVTDIDVKQVAAADLCQPARI